MRHLTNWTRMGHTSQWCVTCDDWNISHNLVSCWNLKWPFPFCGYFSINSYTYVSGKGVPGTILNTIARRTWLRNGNREDRIWQLVPPGCLSQQLWLRQLLIYMLAAVCVVSVLIPETNCVFVPLWKSSFHSDLVRFASNLGPLQI